MYVCMSSLILNHFYTQNRQSNPLQHNIYSTIYRLISLYSSDWSSVFYIYLAFPFVHFLFTRFKISLSLHLYNINSTVLSHRPAASLEASRLDSSLIICLCFIHHLTSLSHRAANWQKGSTCTKSPGVAFSLRGQSDEKWMVLLFHPHERSPSLCSTTRGCINRLTE